MDEIPVSIGGKKFAYIPAVVKTADVGIERGCFLGVRLDIEGEGWGTGGPGIVLDTFDGTRKCRVGTAYGCEFIRCVLTALGVESFGEVRRRPVDVLYDAASSAWGQTMNGFRCRKMHGGSGEWFIFADVIDPATGKPLERS